MHDLHTESIKNAHTPTLLALCAESAVCGAAGHPPGPRLVVMTPSRDQSTVGRWERTKAVTDLHCSDHGHSDFFKTAITQNYCMQVFMVDQYFRVHASRCSPCWPSPAPPEPAPPENGRILLLLLLFLLHILAFFKVYIC